MLTKEECLKAVELIKESYGEGEFQYNYDEIYLLEQLINEHFELVEKTTPKKPDEIIWSKGQYVTVKTGECPICKSTVWGPDNFCNICGQALDWNEG